MYAAAMGQGLDAELKQEGGGTSALAQSAGPPARPTSMAASELGFVPQDFVRWFHPFELARAGVRAVLADMFGAYADKRELQAALHPRTAQLAFKYTTLDAGELQAAPREELWVDFVADIGDGFNATYAIASLLAREELQLRDPTGARTSTRRGAILIMGGDEVYPAASRLEYEQRTVGPYRAALPYVADERRAPHLFAIPGNHDWYDGLSAFLRQFTQRRWVGGWRTQQERSYFVLELPHRYWVWGIDVQLHSDVDGPQLGYFDAAAEHLAEGDRVILCTAEPSWVKAHAGKHEGYRNIAFVENKVLARGAKVVLVLTGDSHHYARYREFASGRQYITAGGGGAFLHGTHTLPNEIELGGLDVAPVGGRAQARRMKLEEVFPKPAESVAHVRQILSFSRRNRSFALVWGIVWLLLGWSLFSASVPPDSDVVAQDTFAGALARARGPAAAWSSHPYSWLGFVGIVSLLGVLVFAFRPKVRSSPGKINAPVDIRRLPFDLLVWLVLALAPALWVGMQPLETLLGALARSPAAVVLFLLVVCGSMVYVSHSRWLVRIAVGLAHASIHVLSWLLIATLTARVLVPLAELQSRQKGILLQLQQLSAFGSWLVISAVLAGVVSATVFGVYLWFAGKYLPEQLNDVFSAIGVEDYKNFIRLHIDSGGRLTVHAVGVREVPKEWALNADPRADAPFLVPKGEVELDAELIEPPIPL